MATKIKEKPELSCENNFDLLDKTVERITKLRGVAALLRSQAALPNEFATQEEIGNVGWLIDDMLREIENDLKLMDLRSKDGR